MKYLNDKCSISSGSKTLYCFSNIAWEEELAHCATKEKKEEKHVKVVYSTKGGEHLHTT